MSSLLSSSVAVQHCLFRTLSKIPKTFFLMTRRVSAMKDVHYPSRYSQAVGVAFSHVGRFHRVKFLYRSFIISSLLKSSVNFGIDWYFLGSKQKLSLGCHSFQKLKSIQMFCLDERKAVSGFHTVSTGQSAHLLVLVRC